MFNVFESLNFIGGNPVKSVKIHLQWQTPDMKEKLSLKLVIMVVCLHHGTKTLSPILEGLTDEIK